MDKSIIQIHPNDNVLAALQDLPSGLTIEYGDATVSLTESIPAKHKFTISDISVGEHVIMYGVVVGEATLPIPKGSRVSTENTSHATQSYGSQNQDFKWTAPDISKWKGRTFKGYHRADGKVGTQNIWLFVPLVFCENRNINVIKEGMERALGYTPHQSYQVDTAKLINAYKNGADEKELMAEKIVKDSNEVKAERVFQNIDGIKFLTHEGGCGGTPDDAQMLCKLIADYITHPNVAGATILSLGCQHAQIQLLQDALKEINPELDKPVYYYEQQQSKSEKEFIEEIIKQSFIGLIEANKTERQEAPLSQLTLGLECGGSDGFSGISANPALGYASDLLVALGGTAVLSEFPELNGVEQELINRCVNQDLADKFATIMKTYASRAAAVGAGFENNPSPGNVKDGLITDAIKSAGAAKKGGTSPVTDVLDYGEITKEKGLNLLCTPGNDVESTTGLAGAGSNVIVFTTGLGTPTGNPVAPVIKFSTNTKLYNQMRDIIDINAGTIISGEDTIQSKGEELLEYIIKVASGEALPHAVRLGQDDFIPWKRGVSL